MLRALTLPKEDSQISAPLGGASAVAASPHFFEISSKESFSCLHLRSYKLFAESSCSLPLLLKPSENPDFFLQLRTPSCYHWPVASLCSAALQERFNLPDALCPSLETCLQEALLNAVIHGNLAIDSRFQDLSGFERFCQLIETRVTTMPYSLRSVCIRAWHNATHLTIAITDQGDGFRFHHGLPEDGLPHGRGMFFIRSLASNVWIGDDHRTLFIRFDSKGPVCPIAP